MRIKLRLTALFLSVFCFSCFASKQQKAATDQHLEVSMRMIGHQVLLSLGDSSSRVLPVERNENVFKIPFEAEFGFNPDSLATIIDSVITATGIAEAYIVQSITCKTNQVVHSYEVGKVNNVLACGSRSQPKGCYYLQVTLLDLPTSEPTEETTIAAENGMLGEGSPLIKLGTLLLIITAILGGFFLFRISQKKETETDPDIIKLGEYTFNRRSMKLILGEERIELTSKECDLLQLLYESVNDTVERDTILRMVWNDEGDYVGRTLDVFISKLRKKLEADSSIKIANIRGVGYKLIVDA